MKFNSHACGILVLLLALGMAATPARAQKARDRENKEQSKPSSSDSRKDNSRSDVYVVHDDDYGYSPYPRNPNSGRASLRPFRHSAPRIAFVSDRAGSLGLFIMAENGSNLLRLPTPIGNIAEPTFSPGKGRLTFVRPLPGQTGGEVFAMNADGKKLGQMNMGPLGAVRDIAWSPWDDYLLCVSQKDGNAEIYRVDTKGRSQRLTNNPASDTQPTISLDGRQIVFVSDRDGKSALYLMNSDGSGAIRRLTPDSLPPVSDPAFSPLGERVAFVVNNGTASELYIITVGDSRVTLLVHGMGVIRDPVFSPDGRRIAFSSNATGNFAIYAVSLTGAKPERLTFGPSNDTHPTWW